MIFNVGSMFAGVGGICLGFKNSSYNNNKFNFVWSNEIDKHAAITYRKNFNHKLFEADIEKILFDTKREYNDDMELLESFKETIINVDIDILLAGFPCQAFSIAGDQKGFEDERGNLFLSIIEIIKQKKHKPRVLFLENVKNLMSHDKGRTYKIIKDKLQKNGYFVKECIFNTKEFTNLPQNRERIFIVCFYKESDYNKFNFNTILFNEKKEFTNEERIQNISNLIDIKNLQDKKYYYTKEKYNHYFLTANEYLNIPADKRKKVRINIEEEILDYYEFYQLRHGMYVRKNKNGVCPTLTANMGTGGHNVPLIKTLHGIRKLTPKETFLLQGFPIDNGYELPTINEQVSDAKLYKQAGNAVSVPLVTLIANYILKAIS